MKNIIKWFFLLVKHRKSLNPKKISINNKMGGFVHIGYGVRMSECEIKDYVWIGDECRIFRSICENYVSIGPRAIIGENEHSLSFISTSESLYNECNTNLIREHNSKHTYISCDVWIGAGAIIKKGVTVGVGAVVGAGAVVTKDVPPYSVVAGIPAKVIKYRFSSNMISKLMSIDWWHMPYNEIKKIIDDLPNIHALDDSFVDSFVNKCNKVKIGETKMSATLNQKKDMT